MHFSHCKQCHQADHGCAAIEHLALRSERAERLEGKWVQQKICNHSQVQTYEAAVAARASPHLPHLSVLDTLENGDEGGNKEHCRGTDEANEA